MIPRFSDISYALIIAFFMSDLNRRKGKYTQKETKKHVQNDKKNKLYRKLKQLNR